MQDQAEKEEADKEMKRMAKRAGKQQFVFHSLKWTPTVIHSSTD